MTTTSNVTNLAGPQAYLEAADAELRRRYGVSIAALSAERYIEAGRRAGYTPLEIVTWLAEIDGLKVAGPP